MNRECKDVDIDTGFEIDLGDLTNVPTLLQSKGLNSGCPTNRYRFGEYDLVQEHILDAEGFPETYTEVVHSKFSKEWTKAMRY